MNKMKFFVTFILLMYSGLIKSQVINQLSNYGNVLSFSTAAKHDYMFVGSGDIVDISNPSSPTFVSRIDVSNAGHSGVATLVDGNYAYYGSLINAFLDIVDITDPSLPKKVSKVFFHGAACWQLLKKDEVVYIHAAGGLYSIDVTDKTKPMVLDSFALNESARIAIKGTFAYVADYTDGLKIIDISNPVDLKLVKNLNVGPNSSSIGISTNLIFIGKKGGGIDAFNISDPINPKTAFSIQDSIEGLDMEIKNNLIYLTADNHFLIYKIVNNSGLRMARFIFPYNFDQAMDVTLKDNLILVSTPQHGVYILQYDSLGTVGIKDNIEIEQMTVFPNPATSFITLDRNSNVDGMIEIKNIYGQCVQKETLRAYNNRINISALSAGTYILSFTGRTSTWQKKIIKVNE